MKIQIIDIDSWKPYEFNAKKHPPEQIESLAREMREVGWSQNVVLTHDLQVVVGHGRRLAALRNRELDPDNPAWLKGPARILPKDFPTERIRAMRLYDNRIAETDNDAKMLEHELADLARIPEFEPAWTGYSVAELLDILPSDHEWVNDHTPIGEASNSESDPKDDEDEKLAPFPSIIPKRAEPGSVWKCGRHLLVCGDSSDPTLVHSVIGEHEAHSIVTDPPYGLSAAKNSGKKSKGGFMGKEWDYDVPSIEVWRECLRVLKPGGHMLVACGTRTQHRMVAPIEDAGFEIRDVITWLYGSGFPKSLDVSKAIDKEAGAVRECVGKRDRYHDGKERQNLGHCANLYQSGMSANGVADVTTPATAAAREWEGFGTALKPACEFWTLCRKPLSESTVAKNVLKWGTGAINVDAARVRTNDQQRDADAYRRLSFLYSSVCKQPCSLALAQDGLRHIFSALHSCNTSNKALLLDAAGRDDTLPVLSEYVHLAERLFPNGVWCGLELKSLQDFQAGCQSYRHFYDVHAHSLLESAQGGVPSLLYALADICPNLFGRSSTRLNLSNVHPSNSDDLALSLFAFLLCVCVSTPYSNLPQGRFPANLLLDEEASQALDEQTGEVENSKGVSRFFYVAKASKADRNTGLDGYAEKPAHEVKGREEGSAGTINGMIGITAAHANSHPTVKPLRLMRYLARLVTPPGGVVIEPFCGSGTTLLACELEGFSCRAFEQEPHHVDIILARYEGMTGDAPVRIDAQ